MVMPRIEIDLDANMDLDNGSLHDRLMAAQNHLKLIHQRHPFRSQKTLETRVSLIEETQLNLAKILAILIEAQLKRL